MAAPLHNVYVGAETGLLKGINIFKGYWDNLNEIKTPDKSKEIICLNWTDDKEEEICMGLKNKDVAIYDQVNKTFSEPFTLDGGKGNLRNVYKIEDSYITALDSGLVNIWKDEESVSDIQTGDHLQCLSPSPFENTVFGTGGKENDMKLWDVNDTSKPTFQAKNVRDNWLSLRVPVWIMGISFLDENKIVTSTGHHQVRVYDPKTQRRPVLDMTFDEYPLTAMSLYRDNQIIVGNTQGKMALLDVRKGQLVHIFKGFAGAIRSLMCHPTKPVVASCGLDRHLRVHDVNSRDLLHKIYLKSRLNCLLMSKALSDDDDKGSRDSATSNKATHKSSDGNSTDAESDDDDDDNDVWENMEVVQTRTLKKSEVAFSDQSEEQIKPGSKRKGKATPKKDKKKKQT